MLGRSIPTEAVVVSVRLVGMKPLLGAQGPKPLEPLSVGAGGRVGAGVEECTSYFHLVHACSSGVWVGLPPPTALLPCGAGWDLSSGPGRGRGLGPFWPAGGPLLRVCSPPSPALRSQALGGGLQTGQGCS